MDYYYSFVVVTGASEGIGRGYALEVSKISVVTDVSILLCLQLARQGLNVAIMSRSEEKLNQVASTIRMYNHSCIVVLFLL